MIRCKSVDDFLKSLFTPFTFLGIFLLGLSVLPVSAQESPPAEPIKVMLLGTTHLDNPGRDAINSNVPDVLTGQKQKELKELRDALAKFQPNKVALEIRMKYQAGFDSLFQKFKAGKLDTFSIGDFISKRSEQYQIGFKLADRLGHDHVYAVDHQFPMQIGRIMKAAKENDPGYLKYFEGYKQSDLVQKTNTLLQNATFLEFYRFLNSQKRVEKYHEPYVRSATVTDDSVYVGAEVVADYYERNLRIYANLMKVAEPGDRIFMMFGAGHRPFLLPLLKDSPRVEFVDPLDYL